MKIFDDSFHFSIHTVFHALNEDSIDIIQMKYKQVSVYSREDIGEHASEIQKQKIYKYPHFK